MFILLKGLDFFPKTLRVLLAQFLLSVKLQELLKVREYDVFLAHYASWHVLNVIHGRHIILTLRERNEYH